MIAFLVVALASSVPAAATDRIAPVFSNTIVSTYPDGRKAHLWMNPDGTYRATGRCGKPSSGKWSVKGDRICLKQSKPFAGPFSYCTEIHTGGVGASWKAKAVTGEPITVALVPGR